MSGASNRENSGSAKTTAPNLPNVSRVGWIAHLVKRFSASKLVRVVVMKVESIVEGKVKSMAVVKVTRVAMTKTNVLTATSLSWARKCRVFRLMPSN